MNNDGNSIIALTEWFSWYWNTNVHTEHLKMKTNGIIVLIKIFIA